MRDNHTIDEDDEEISDQDDSEQQPQSLQEMRRE